MARRIARPVPTGCAKARVTRKARASTPTLRRSARRKHIFPGARGSPATAGPRTSSSRRCANSSGGRRDTQGNRQGAAMSRTEQDFLGQREIADDVYYGVQTIRGRENFHITGIPMSQEPYFVKALGYVKKAAAMANRDLNALDATVADAIISACDRVISGEMN